MEVLKIDSRYIAHKLIQRLYEEGKINKSTYDNVQATYPPVPEEPPTQDKKNGC